MTDSRSRADSMLDEALEETFPASDPPANTVETGIRTGDLRPARDAPVTDNRTGRRFELTVNGETAFLVYERTADALTLIHTEVPPALRGRHLGEALVEAALNAARSAGLRVIAVCPFARAYMRKHPPPQQAAENRRLT
jgi:predicted GNAT family acetyltransferase